MSTTEVASGDAFLASYKGASHDPHVTFWLNGKIAAKGVFSPLPNIGDRIVSEGEFYLIYVVRERWFAKDGWHVVVREPEGDTETTPPWDRAATS